MQTNESDKKFRKTHYILVFSLPPTYQHHHYLQILRVDIVLLSLSVRILNAFRVFEQQVLRPVKKHTQQKHQAAEYQVRFVLASV